MKEESSLLFAFWLRKLSFTKNFQPSHLWSKIKELSFFHLGYSWMEDYLKTFYLGKAHLISTWDASCKTATEDAEQSGQNVNSVREIAVLLNKVIWNLTIFLLHPSVFNRKSNNLHTNIFTNYKKPAANSIWQTLTTDTFKATLRWDESLMEDTRWSLLLRHTSQSQKQKAREKGKKDRGRAHEHRADRQKRKNRENR